MIKYNLNNINDWNFDNDNITKVYRNNAVVYQKITTGGTPPTPTGSTCYEIISTPISSYTSTTYDSVYSFNNTKWYMKNNLNQYEEYGIYDVVNDIALATTYDGKLAVVGTTEYQYSGSSWVVVGTYEVDETTYTITEGDEYEYQGVEIPTTFKIPMSDFEENPWLSFEIVTQDNYTLGISSDRYFLRDEEWNEEEGSVSDDGEYYYYELPDTNSIVIDRISYWDMNPIHIITGVKQISVEYPQKDMPLADVYNTVSDMEAVGCPNVGVGQYGVVGNDTYQFDGEDWNSVSNYKLMEKNTDGKANVIACNSSTSLVVQEAQPSYFGNITDVVIGDCVTSIGNNAFSGCSSLTSCAIGSGVTSIGYNAFMECSSLTSIDIPSGVTSIGSQTFYYCRSLTSCTIGSGVTSIGTAAFSVCSSLTSIDIPSGVTSIGGSAFYGCSSFTSIDIPSGVTSIGASTFANCSSLKSCTIGSGVTSIDYGAFANCRSLTSIVIPNSVTSIGETAFQNCSGLSSITVNATTPPTLANANAFNNTNNCPIYVPAASVNAYKTATNWSTYASRIQAIP